MSAEKVEQPIGPWTICPNCQTGFDPAWNQNEAQVEQPEVSEEKVEHARVTKSSEGPAKEKVLAVWPNAFAEPFQNGGWRVFKERPYKGFTIIGRGETEEAAWQNAAESLPAQAEPTVEGHMRNMHKVIDCYAEANQVEVAEDCRIYADYAKTRLIGSGTNNRRAWADAVLCCTCTCDHLKAQHQGGMFCNTQDCHCQEFISVKPATRAVEGTYACPICGCATPHAHSDEQIAEWRNPEPVAPVEAEEKCKEVSKYGCICLLDSGHEGDHDPKCGWGNHKFPQTVAEPKPTPKPVESKEEVCPHSPSGKHVRSQGANTPQKFVCQYCEEEIEVAEPKPAPSTPAPEAGDFDVRKQALWEAAGIAETMWREDDNRWNRCVRQYRERIQNLVDTKPQPDSSSISVPEQCVSDKELEVWVQADGCYLNAAYAKSVIRELQQWRKWAKGLK